MSVVTITKDRYETFVRAAESVRSQDYKGEIEHVVIGDRSIYLANEKISLVKKFPQMKIYNYLDDFPRPEHNFSSVARIAFLRNLGTEYSSGLYIAQIGDDDIYEKNHISSLVSLLQKDRYKIAYSWRQLVHFDGRPYLDEMYPWTAKPRGIDFPLEFGSYIYSRLVDSGILEKGSNIMKDRITSSDGENIFTVDCNEMLIPRSVLSMVRWKDSFSWRELSDDNSDDLCLLRALYSIKQEFICSEKASLIYCVGGLSSSIEC